MGLGMAKAEKAIDGMWKNGQKEMRTLDKEANEYRSETVDEILSALDDASDTGLELSMQFNNEKAGMRAEMADTQFDLTKLELQAIVGQQMNAGELHDQNPQPTPF